MTTTAPIIVNSYTALALFEGTDINPNGDPDNEGAPRVDDHTGQGLKSPQSTSRRIYDRVQLVMDGVPGYALQIQRGTTIEAGILAAAADANVTPPAKKGQKPPAEDMRSVAKAACARFFDTRMGGAVLNVGSCPAEGVNGVATLAWGRSVYPVNIRRDAITRVCATNTEQEKTQEMGRRYAISHAVYTQPLFVNPHHAATNGATLRDLAVYLDSLLNMFEFKRSVMSGVLSMRGLWVFRHDSPFGNAPAHTLLERVQVSSPKGPLASSWSDYDVHFDAKALPAGVKVFTIEDMLGGFEAIESRLSA